MCIRDRDREERPDLDQTYMLARQVLTDSGGWPNNLFLTPDLNPFFAGSYFPPEDQGETNGFPTILKLIQGDWQQSPAKIKASTYTNTRAGARFEKLRVAFMAALRASMFMPHRGGRAQANLRVLPWRPIPGHRPTAKVYRPAAGLVC